MDVYKAKIKSNGSIDELRLRIVVRSDLQNKEMIGDTWYPIASMRTLKYFLSDGSKHKSRVHQTDSQLSVKCKIYCIIKGCTYLTFSALMMCKNSKVILKTVPMSRF